MNWITWLLDSADWLWWQYNQVFSIGPNCTSFPDKFNFPLSQALLITCVCPVSYLNKKKKFKTNQSSKTASELTCMTYKKYFTKQKKAFNRGGIVEGSGLYQQPCETPRNTTKLLILVISGWPRVWPGIQSKHV